MDEQRKIHDALLQEFAQQGKLLALGFMAMRLQVIPADASAVQVDEMRMAYFTGAQHLYASLMTVFDPSSDEPTEADLRKMGQIAAELDAFTEEMKLRIASTGTSQ